MAMTVLVERDVKVPMRDGVRLATDVYRPKGDGPWPVLVERTPYGKSFAWFTAGLIVNPLVAAERGYAVVVQDTRGRNASQGPFEPFVHEADDGYDTVEWAAGQPWSNGAVGVFGSSYLGVTALTATLAAPPHLKAAVSYLTGANYHDGWTYSGGAFELSFNLWWTSFLAWDTVARARMRPKEREATLAELVEVASDWETAARHLPLADLPAFRKVAPYWREWLEHPSYDAFWKRVDQTAKAGGLKVPLLQVAGWFDNFARGAIDMHAALQSVRGKPKTRSRLVIGPWDHEAYLSVRPTASGSREFGPAAVGGVTMMGDLVLDWFDEWLGGGAPSAASEAAPVRYFVMGENRWAGALTWPPKHRPTPWYLRSAGAASSRLGDGALSLDKPGPDPADSFLYDPADPVPSIGGRTLAPIFGPGGIQDQSDVELRDDVLVYTSPMLTGPVSIAGPVTAVLHVASSAVDTDFTAKLVDVEPDGFCANIAEGIIRARYRDGHAREALLTPGEPTELTVDLWHVAHTFLPGHMIRLEVSSSSFPRWDRNLNCATSPGQAGPEELQVAVQQVLHDPAHPSRLLLPVVG
jgi:putative CocE/NonD family hydrolase